METTSDHPRMRAVILSIVLGLLLKAGLGQSMRPVRDFIKDPDSGWLELHRMLDSATNKVELLPGDSAKGAEALYHTQISTRSALGIVVYKTGGLLIDGGWIRVLGSGSARLPRCMPDWNKGKTFQNYGERPAYFLVADDAIGGFFALNLGELGKDIGAIYYLAPDNLKWESDFSNYDDFIWFCFTGNIKKFYGDYRWKGWQHDLDTMGGDRAFYIYPPLWSKEGKDIEKDLRRAVPMEELFNHTMEMRKQMGIQ